jgi:hypothetical protein
LARRLPDIITAFKEYSAPFNAGSAFIETAAVWMVSTTATRQVGSKLRGQFTSPNLFFMLVSGPGAGKSQTIKAVRSVLQPATGFSFIPQSVTRAGLQDFMQENLKTRRAPDGTLLPSNECIALSDEIQGILPEHDIGHLTFYNELYDSLGTYQAITRSNGTIRLESPYCSIITGVQPAFLAMTIPEQAWGMGFMSRTIMIFDQAKTRTSAFEFDDVDHKLKAEIISDLKDVRTLFGYFKWEKSARALYEEWWVKNGGPPIPQNKRLAMGYNARRDLHFFKLAMTFSLSRSSELLVTVKDAGRAIEYLVRSEDRMRHIFNEMASTGAVAAYGDVIDAVRLRSADGGFMPEADLIHMLMDRFQPTQIHALVDNLLQSQVLALRAGSVVGVGLRSFVPGSKMGSVL